MESSLASISFPLSAFIGTGIGALAEASWAAGQAHRYNRGNLLQQTRVCGAARRVADVDEISGLRGGSGKTLPWRMMEGEQEDISLGRKNKAASSEQEEGRSKQHKPVPISDAARAALWAHFTAHIASSAALPRPGIDPALDALLSLHNLSRTQASRQFDRYRCARRSENPDPTVRGHAALTSGGHERRVFGEDGTLRNRLHSIARDADFVRGVARRFEPRLPVCANLRCGAWYVDCEERACDVYFKSTDGHAGQWCLNLRRLNLQLLPLVAERGGAVIVDSTRRGRALSDALAKTIPIWAACVNRAVEAHRGSTTGWCTRLHTPPSVDDAERVNIEERLEGMVASMCTSGVDIKALADVLQKPLRPLWIVQSREGHAYALSSASGGDTPDALSISNTHNLPFYPLFLVSASAAVHMERLDGYTYLQGAADDDEHWAPNGFAPALFWKHSARLLEQRTDAACRDMTGSLAEEESRQAQMVMQGGHSGQSAQHPSTLPRGDVTHASRATVVDGTQIAFACRGGMLAADSWEHFDAILSVTPAEPASSLSDDWDRVPPDEAHFYLRLPIVESKRDRSSLEEQLPHALRFAALHISHRRRILVHSAHASDTAVAVTIAILVALLNDDLSPKPSVVQALPSLAEDKAVRAAVALSRSEGKQRMLRCVHMASQADPGANILRLTLKKLNHFFMSSDVELSGAAQASA